MRSVEFMEIRRGIKPRSESSLPPPRHRHRHPSAAPLLAWLLVIYRAGSAPARRALLGLGPRSTINNPQLCFFCFSISFLKPHSTANQAKVTTPEAGRGGCAVRAIRYYRYHYRAAVSSRPGGQVSVIFLSLPLPSTFCWHALVDFVT